MDFYPYICIMDNQKLVSEITQALLEIEKSEGVKIDFGFSTNYTGITFSGSIQDNESIEKEKALNLSACRRIGFTQNIVGITFNLLWENYTWVSPNTPGPFRVTGIQTKNRKYPVIAENLVNGKSYKFSVNSIKKALGGDQLINRISNLEKLTQNDPK